MEKRRGDGDLVARVDRYHISQKDQNQFMVWMERWPANPRLEYPPITLYSASLWSSQAQTSLPPSLHSEQQGSRNRLDVYRWFENLILLTQHPALSGPDYNLLKYLLSFSGSIFDQQYWEERRLQTKHKIETRNYFNRLKK